MLQHLHKQRHSYTIGILSIETKNKSKLPEKHTYFYTSYVKWLEQANLKWLQISENDSQDIIQQKLNYVDAMFLPGGSAVFYDDKKQPTNYKSTLQTIFQYANQQNDNGNIFPVVGTCLGFEFMLQILTNEQLKLKSAVNENNSEIMYLLPEYTQSFLSKIFSFEQLINFSKDPAFYFTHHEGYLMKDVQDSEVFNKNFNALGYYLTETHEKALGIFEHKRYPYVGWQFHPEKVQFEHQESLNLNRCEESLDLNERFSATFQYLLKNKEPKKTSYETIMKTRKGLYIIEEFGKMDEAYIFPPNLIQF